MSYRLQKSNKKLIIVVDIMKGPFKLGKFELYWLEGGEFELDGGSMFGVVPKVLWSKKYPVDKDNYIPLVANPILIKSENTFLLIDSGLGNKLNDKQKQIYRVKKDWNIIEELKKLCLARENISYVILTHFDFDHSGGVVMFNEDKNLELTFPNAKHILQKKEWDVVINPDRRSSNTFWQINYEILKESGNIFLIDGEFELIEGIKLFHTGGHNSGHQIVILESYGNMAIHFGDLMPMHSHFNPLWVMAYDNYPMDSIKQKEYWEDYALQNNAWFTFYHDPFLCTAKFDKKGNVIERWPE